jgi:hypothetical protein
MAGFRAGFPSGVNGKKLEKRRLRRRRRKGTLTAIDRLRDGKINWEIGRAME